MTDSVTLDGVTFEASDWTGIDGYGYLLPVTVDAAEYSRFIALFVAGQNELGDIRDAAEAFADAAEVSSVSAAASAVAAAAQVAELSGTSSTSLTIGSGSKAPNVGTGKAWVPGMGMKVARTSDPAGTWMIGTVVTYVTGTGVATITVGATSSDYAGSGTYSDWTISFSGSMGPAGAEGFMADVQALQTSGFTAVVNTRTPCKFSAAATITGPAAAADGDVIMFSIAGGQNVSFNPNGLDVEINGVVYATTRLLGVISGDLILTYIDDRWT